MPLPTNPETMWPPNADLQRTFAEHDAWYSGDTDKLAGVYSGLLDPAPLRNLQTAPRRSFRFWSQAKDAPARRQRLHLPLPGDIATTSADLLFSEPPQLTAENGTTQAVLDELVEENGLWSRLLEAAEISSALGGVYLRAVWDASFSDLPMPTVVHPDAAVPTWRWGRLQDVVFWRVVLEGPHGEVFRHLELHERGRVVHALYRGTKQLIGSRVELTQAGDPQLDAIASMLVNGDTIETVPGLNTAIYVPNMLPNRRRRGSAEGRSDYDTIEGVFDALDETWTSLMRDLRLGRARILVANEMLRSGGPGRGAAFDLDREVYEGLEMHPDQGDPITEVQFDIRVEDHLAMADALTRQAIATAGYSGRSFGLHEQGGAATATEVHSAERRSFVTRAKKAEYFKPAIRQLSYVLLQLASTRFNRSGISDEMPGVELPDGVQDSPESTATTIELLERARAASTDTKVRMLHPDWDDTRVDQEVRAILQQGGVLIDPMQAGQLP